MVSLTSLSKKERGCINDIVNLFRESDDPEKDVEKMVEQLNNTRTLDNQTILKIVNTRLKELELNPSYNDILHQIAEIIQFPTEESCTYVFLLKLEKDGEKIQLSLTAESILVRIKFDAAYMAATSKVPLGDSTTFRVFLAKVLSGAKVKKTERAQDVDELGEAKDVIYRFIEGATLVDKPEDTQFSSENIWLSEGNLYVPSQTIRKILEREKFSFPMRKMRVAFDKVLVGSSKKVRIGGKTSRFWVFSINKLNPEIQMKMKIVHGDDEETPSSPPVKPLPTPNLSESVEVKDSILSPDTVPSSAPTPEQGRGSQTIRVEFLRDVPQYIAQGEKGVIKLGAFKAGDVAVVPRHELPWLMKNKFIKEVPST